MADHPPNIPVLGNDDELSSSSSPVIPGYIVLRTKTNDEYLQYLDEPGNNFHSHLDYSGDNTTLSPKMKFEVLARQDGSSRYVHIKSCYNNKYWEYRSNSAHITATADEPREDENTDACTLFEPIYIDDDDDDHGRRRSNKYVRTLRFRHVATKQYLSPVSCGPRHERILQAWELEPDDVLSGDVCVAIKWDSIRILPAHLLFKGNNGKYLKAYPHRGSQYMAFQSDDPSEESVAHRIIHGRDGTISIRNDYLDKFWRSNDDPKGWIYVNADYSSTQGVHFRPSKASDGKIALKSLHNNLFCTYSNDDSTSCLSASSRSIVPNAEMTIEEPVESRVIDRVKYRTAGATREDEIPHLVDHDVLENPGSDTKDMYTKAITLTDTRSNTWEYMGSFTLKVSTTLETSIPLLVKGEIELSSEFCKSYKKGGIDKTEVEVSAKYTAQVPPKSKLRMSLVSTKSTCNIPFSYVQHDTLTNGTVDVKKMDGGIYSGTSSYRFRFETEQTPL